MRKDILRILLLVYLLPQISNAQTYSFDKTRDGFLVFHPIKTDDEGKIVSWYGDEPGEAFDFVIRAVWNFWDTMRIDMNGLPYYMNHQVWLPDKNDFRGIGGDQLSMALSAWSLLYAYTGNEKIIENMKFIADYYLSHGLSAKNAKWPNIPFPYNTLIYSGYYDGDMVIGKDFTQPDKAGAFGDELITLYKMVGNIRYLNAAVDIANTLAGHTKNGDDDHSPLPFKVDAYSGEIGVLNNYTDDGIEVTESAYTSNWVGSLNLFEELIELDAGNVEAYKNAYTIILKWMKTYPLRTNKWGPFFEDIPGWSDTQINAVTFARYIMLHQDKFPAWKENVRGIFNWVYEKLENDDWKKYGVRVVNEQTVYQAPGNSHTSRQAAAELQYASLAHDESYVENDIRQLLWATYMVDDDGKNNYPRDQVWLTDGYGDYVRHFLRAMAVMPALAPSSENHILHSTSVVIQVGYAPYINKGLIFEVPDDEQNQTLILYKTSDPTSTETLRMTARPSAVLCGDMQLNQLENLNADGWVWQALGKGGVLKIKHSTRGSIKIMK